MQSLRPFEEYTDTQRIHAWVHSLTRRGWDIADASRGKPSFPADLDAVRAMQSVLKELDHNLAPYGTSPLGEYPYRRQAADGLSREYGIEFYSEEIMFTPGGQCGLAMAFWLVQQLRPGSVILCPSPWYLNHAELASMMYQGGLHRNTDSKPVLYPIHTDSESGWRITEQSLNAAIYNARTEGKDIGGFLFCNPANPTGVVTRKEEWDLLAPILRNIPEVPIMLDEAFCEIIFNEDFSHSLLHAAPDLKERVILFRSGTKALGLSGERLALHVAPLNWMREFTYLQSRLIANAPLSQQAGMAAAMQDMSPAKKIPISRYYQKNAEFLFSAMKSLGITTGKADIPEGGFYFLIDLSCLLGRKMPNSAKELLGENLPDIIKNDCDIIIAMLCGLGQGEKQGLALVAGSSFGLLPEKAYVRISFSSTREEITKIIDRITKAVKS